MTRGRDAKAAWGSRASRSLLVLTVLLVAGASGCSCGADRDDAVAPPLLCVSAPDQSACDPDGSALDWGNPPAGEVTTHVLSVRNRAESGEPLVIESIRVSDAAGAARLFDLQLCHPTCDDQILGFPASLSAGQVAQLVITYDGTHEDGVVPAETLEIVSNTADDEVDPVGIYQRPFEGVMDGCLTGRLDANDDKSDGCECAPTTDGSEACDGFDNDCDGEVDEDLVGVGIPCNTGLLGVCADGETVCDAGVYVCGQLVSESAEVCDGTDNDCDGQLDEDNSWRPFNEGLSGGNMEGDRVAFDPRFPGTAYAVTGSRVYQSVDDGATFALVGESTSPITSMGFPANRHLVILAASYGGLIESDDGGESWTSVSLSGIALSTLLVHPADPARLYVGTNGGGILRSTNGGTSFSAVNAGVPYGNVASIASYSDDVDDVVAGIQLAEQSGFSELIRTTDGGASWQTVLDSVRRVYRLGGCPGDGDVLYAAIFDTGLMQSVDAGATWTMAALAGSTATSVAMAPSDCTRIYSGTQFTYGGFGAGVYRSDDGGSIFAGPLGDLETERPGPHTLAVHPTMSSTVLLSNHSGLFRTVDAGATWQRVPGIDAVAVRKLAVSEAAPDKVWMASWGQGPWSRAGSANDWESIPATSIPRDWGFTVVPDQDDAQRVLVGGWGDLWRSVDAGASFNLVSGPINVFDADYDRTDSNNVYLATQVGGVWKSVDGGQSFTQSNSGLPDAWYTPACNPCRDSRSVLVDTLDADTVFLGTNPMGLFRSTDGAATWQPAGPFAGESISIVEQDSSGELWTCVSGKGLWLSVDGGDTFTKATEGIAELNNCTGVFVDPSNDDVYATSDLGVYRSSDGATWEDLDSMCLPSSGNSPVLLTEQGQRTLLVGTGGLGVYALGL